MQISRFLLHLTRCIATKKPKSSLLTAATMLPVSPLSSPSKLAVPNRLSYVSPSSITARRQVFRASSLSSPSQPADATAAGVSEAPWWKQEHPAVQVQPHKVGSVHLIMGPMFAGKSTALCSKVRTLRSEGHNVAIVNSALDTRSSFNTVGTHDGDSLPAVPVQRLVDFVGKPEYEWATHICVDEAQFFQDLLDFTHTAVEHHGKSVVIAGLSGDFRRQKFGQILDLVPMADSITKLQARCSCCSEPTPAHFTLRVSGDESQVAVGGSDKYIPVCRAHYVELNTIRSRSSSPGRG